MLVWAGYSPDKRREVKGNPCCGFYTIYRFYAHSDDPVPGMDGPLEELGLDKTQSLCLLLINLVFYKDSPLALDALGRVKRIFSWFKEQQKELIVRFVYDWDGLGVQHEPREIGVILRHMEQLGPLFHKFSRHIYILQGLFIGSWGEMHSSRFLDEHSLATLAHQLYACSSRDTFIVVRSPSIWRTIFRTHEPLAPVLAYGNNMPARFGLFNDGLLASETDIGTYGEVFRGISSKYSDKLTRREEHVFQEKLCRFVPNGGETVGLTPYHEFNSARQAFATMRISYLNSRYDPRVLNMWKKTKTGLNDSLWKEKSIYDYMASHLGYRLAVERIKINREKNGGRKMQVRLELSNQGFAGTYRSFNVSLLVRTPAFTRLHAFPVQVDSRRWLPHAPVTLTWNLDYGDWESGVYALGIKIWDPLSEKTVRLANTYPLDYNGMHGLGYIKFDAGLGS